MEVGGGGWRWWRGSRRWRWRWTRLARMSLVSATESELKALCCAKALMIELDVVSAPALSVPTET